MGTHYQGSETERLALDVYIKLARSAESVGQRINHHLADYNLTVSQFGVLEALYHLGPMHQTDLARRILKSSGNLTMVIDNLARRGLVERCPDAQDRRCVNVHLTEAGRALLAELFPRHVAIVVAEMSALTPVEQRELARLCRLVGLGPDA